MINSWIIFLFLSLDIFAAPISRPSCSLHFRQYGVCAQLTWIQGPRIEEVSTLKIQFFDPRTWEPRGPLEMKIQMLMPEMPGMEDMCLAQPPTLRGGAPTDPVGEYVVDDLIFGMEGRWHVNVEIKDGARPSEKKTQCLEFQGSTVKSC